MTLSRRRILGAGAGAVAAGALAACSPDRTSTPPSVAAAGADPGSASAPAGPAPAENPSDGWDIGRAAPATALAAYTADSIRSGESLPLHVSAASPWRVSIFRMGGYGGRGGAQVAEGNGPARRFSATTVDQRTRAVSAGWPTVAELDTTGWRSGLYLAVVRSKDGATTIPFVVRGESARGRIAVIAASMTWQAYNVWGGASLYFDTAGSFDARSYAVSYDRPYDHELFGSPIAYGFDIPVAQLIDELGLDHVWFTNADIDRNPGLLDGARAVVSTGHDEYWSAPYRRALTEARDAGADLAILGANAGYWRVTTDADRGLVSCAKDGAIQPANLRWRDLGQPEASLTGVMYDAYPVRGPMIVRDPDFALFEGLRLQPGATFPGLIGIESDRYYPAVGAPTRIQAPTLSPVTCRGVPTWSTMTYSSVASGANVWASGTMNWTHALRGPLPRKGITAASADFARTVTANLFTGMAEASLLPARRDVPDLPGHNTSGAA